MPLTPNLKIKPGTDGNADNTDHTDFNPAIAEHIVSTFHRSNLSPKQQIIGQADPGTEQQCRQRHPGFDSY